ALLVPVAAVFDAIVWRGFGGPHTIAKRAFEHRDHGGAAWTAAAIFPGSRPRINHRRSGRRSLRYFYLLGSRRSVRIRRIMDSALLISPHVRSAVDVRTAGDGNWTWTCGSHSNALPAAGPVVRVYAADRRERVQHRSGPRRHGGRAQDGHRDTAIRGNASLRVPDHRAPVLDVLPDHSADLQVDDTRAIRLRYYSLSGTAGL